MKNNIKKIIATISWIIGIIYIICLLILMGFTGGWKPAITLHNYFINHLRITLYIVLSLGTVFFVGFAICIFSFSLKIKAKSEIIQNNHSNISLRIDKLKKKLISSQISALENEKKLSNNHEKHIYKIKLSKQKAKCAYESNLMQASIINKKLYKIAKKSDLAN